ncbi:MAG: uroporphyrinogen decarboxylase family protein [Candidatus Lokiarchaeota archaeon]|nr:uroporphyrinogen decarboxylase family protein [Candidatus Lokiarchaeota archaeon]
MDSFERIYAALRGRPVDRPPVFPQIGDHAGIINNLSYDLMYQNAEKAAEAHLKALKLYGYDITTIQVEPSWPVAEACGAEVNYPPDKNPWITKHLIQSENDLENLGYPDFLETTSSRVMIEGTSILVEEAEAPVAAFMTGPITFSLQLMPYVVLIKMMIKNPEFIQKLVKKSVKIIEEYIKALKNAGATVFVVCEHDFQMLKHEQIKEFSLDYLPSLFDIFDYNILHMCGRVAPHLNALAQDLKQIKNINTLSIGPYVDISETQELLNHDIGIAGNIDHVRLLPFGSTKEVEAAVHKAIEASGEDSRFIVAPGCEITSDTPIENVKALVKAAQTF